MNCKLLLRRIKNDPSNILPIELVTFSNELHVRYEGSNESITSFILYPFEIQNISYKIVNTRDSVNSELQIWGSIKWTALEGVFGVHNFVVADRINSYIHKTYLYHFEKMYESLPESFYVYVHNLKLPLFTDKSWLWAYPYEESVENSLSGFKLVWNCPSRIPDKLDVPTKTIQMYHSMNIYTSRTKVEYLIRKNLTPSELRAVQLAENCPHSKDSHIFIHKKLNGCDFYVILLDALMVLGGFQRRPRYIPVCVLEQLFGKHVNRKNFLFHE